MFARRIAAKQDISSIIIYETFPTKRIVAEAEIVDVLMLSKDKLWDMTKEESGITKEFYDAYFEDKDIRDIVYEIKYLNNLNKEMQIANNVLGM